LLDPHCWETVSNGLYVCPPAELVLELSRSARERIYGVLAHYPPNSAQCHPFRFRPETFDQWLAQTGLGEEQLAIVRKLSYRDGDSLCFCDGAIVQGAFCSNDFKRLVKALYGEPTFLMRLRINRDTDLDALVRYWDHRGNVEVHRPLFESMSRLPGGASINIGALLPPFVRAHLYTFANPAKDPLAARKNCFWTAMNFFSEQPDDRFFDAQYVQQVLASDYSPTTDKPEYGDLIAVQDGAGALIHLCVYLIDDVVFTKNGRDTIEPWVLMKMPDMLACYRPKQSGRVTTFRQKH
jgi:hypothetical protein